MSSSQHEVVRLRHFTKRASPVKNVDMRSPFSFDTLIHYCNESKKYQNEKSANEQSRTSNSVISNSAPTQTRIIFSST